MSARRVAPVSVMVGLTIMIAALTSIIAAGQSAAGAASDKWPARLADGQPDVQGDWDAEISGSFALTDPRTGGARLVEQEQEHKGVVRSPNPSRVVDPPDGKVPYQPWALAKRDAMAPNIEHPTKPEHIDPLNRCLPSGPIREMFHSQARFIQTPGQVVIVYAQNHIFRIIPLDGRPHVGERTKLWMGDSRGHWEGTTLVVDVTNLNAKGRLAALGDFSSDAVHMVERFVFLDARTMRYENTITDPSVYTRPWTIAAKFSRGRRNEGQEYWEDACHEGERSAESMLIPTTEHDPPVKP
jgi:hypothetical protein